MQIIYQRSPPFLAKGPWAPSSITLPPLTFDLAGHLAGGPTDPPGKYQAARRFRCKRATTHRVYPCVTVWYWAVFVQFFGLWASLCLTSATSFTLIQYCLTVIRPLKTSIPTGALVKQIAFIAVVITVIFDRHILQKFIFALVCLSIKFSGHCITRVLFNQAIGQGQLQMSAENAFIYTVLKHLTYYRCFRTIRSTNWLTYLVR